jgi:class 3 adenylate cyclase
VDPPITRYAVRGEMRIAYQVFGDGPLDLVFCDELCPIDVAWLEPRLASFLRRLGEFSRVVYYDTLGTGASDQVRLDALPALQQWADDVETVAQAAGLKRAAVLGYSAAGQRAAYDAATRPESVSALVLVNTAARFVRDANYPWGLPREKLDAFVAAQEERWGTGANLEAVSPRHARDERLRRWFGLKERLGAPPVAAMAFWRWLAESDIRSVLPAIRMPTLVIHTAGNRQMRVGHGRYLAEHIPAARYIELDSDEHLLHTDQAEEIGDAIEEFLTGATHRAALDRVLATVLFTDICGSTERAAALGDRAWKRLLDVHDALVAEELDRFRGRRVKSTGDGVMATFDGPARAVECAHAIGDALAGIDLDVRAGLHAGEIELRDNGDIGGISVHIGARIAALAGSGEVLTSSTVRALVAGSGIVFEDHGEHRLKGVPEDWRLFRVLRRSRSRSDSGSR